MLITGRVKLIGIIGYPITHSLSPIMQNAAFEVMGLDYAYVPLEVEPQRLWSAVQALRALEFRGFNVTIPHKQRIMRYLDRVTPEAKRVGAVNTVENRNGCLIGHNTDGPGFHRAFIENTGGSVKGRRVLILGAGGAARAVAFQFAREGASDVMITNRSGARARSLVRDMGRQKGSTQVSWVPWTKTGLKDATLQADIVVNATSVGMRVTDPSLVPAFYLKANHVVCDLVYRPLETDLLRMARRAGSKVIDGLGMLVHQGARSFEIWTGKQPPVEIMRQSLQVALSRSPPREGAGAG